jgi:hypothetical protein
VIYFDEGTELGSVDPDAVYGAEVLPKKLALGQLYAEHVSLRLDVRVIWLTLTAIFTPWRASRAALTIARRLDASVDIARPACAIPPAAPLERNSA